MKNMNKALIGASVLLPALAMANEGAATGAPSSVYWGAGLCMGVAAAVGAYSQSRAAVAALEGMGRNPAASKTLFVPMILSLALMESLVLLAFVISNTLAGK